MLKEITHPLSTDISRQSFIVGSGIFTALNLLTTYAEYQNTKDSIPFLEAAAEDLTQERKLITQYLQFREGYRDEGYDMSHYSLWNATQHIGLIHALAETNHSPLISKTDSFQTSEAIKSMNNRILDNRAPDYEKNIEIDKKSAYLGAGASVGIIGASLLDNRINTPSVPYPKKVSRRNVLNAMLVTCAGLNFGAAVQALSHVSQYDMVNHPAYQNIPPEILKTLAYSTEYNNFINFYNNSLATLPDLSLLRQRSSDEFYLAQRAKWDEVDIAWTNRTSQEDENKIKNKALYLESTTYEAYRERYQAVKDAVQKYQPRIRDAQPDNPILNYRQSPFSDVTTMGAGLQLLNIVYRNQPNLAFTSENATMQ